MSRPNRPIASKDTIRRPLPDWATGQRESREPVTDRRNLEREIGDKAKQLAENRQRARDEGSPPTMAFTEALDASEYDPDKTHEIIIGDVHVHSKDSRAFLKKARDGFPR